MKRSPWFIMVLIFLVLAAGCSAPPSGQVQQVKSADEMPSAPVKLSFYLDVPLTDEEFDKIFKQPIAVKYPNVTLELIRKGKGMMPQDLMAAGIVPDIILAASTTVMNWQGLGMVEDLAPLIKGAGIDMNQFDPAITESLKMYTTSNEIIGLPYVMNWVALFYNKDIFDKMAVPYPKDGMDWEAAQELNKKLTRTVDGVEYRGLDPDTVDKMGFGLSLDYVDAKTGKAMLDTQEWKKVLETALMITSIPGHNIGGSSIPNFTDKQNTAMIVGGITSDLQRLHSDGHPMNWDMVTMPNFKEGLGTARELDAHYMVLNKQSANKQAAFQVMRHIISDEVQNIVVRSGRLSSLKQTEEHKKIFASDLPALQGKNFNAAFGAKIRKNHYTTPYDGQGRSEIKKALTEMQQGKDVNTALRDANERFTQYLEKEKKG
ncbi:ABC transporter substrate-binding protein [Paenibacillus sp. OAS669]|uniref:ABC transporter substrate-binding protein n=1 Tax=Paenibacillus sp. OAS669 TaxID=2663821 RepID=UPI00178929B1|nr:extracellular solute-binding protein [Paenibacillus sp. OAS669]MBE1440700.1 multiple sugar transport system substrate-binding protein [Paenibacillus sp. OAS669]